MHDRAKEGGGPGARGVGEPRCAARSSSTSTGPCSAWRRRPMRSRACGPRALLEDVCGVWVAPRRCSRAGASPMRIACFRHSAHRLGRARHGAARQPGGPILTLAPPIPASVVQAMNNIARLAAGILVEQKGCGVAVHYRNAPLARQALESEVAAIIAASSYELVLREGRKVLEAVPRGYSKGTALLRLAAATAVQRAAPHHDRRRRGRRSRRSRPPSASAASDCAWRASTSGPRRRTSAALPTCAPGSRRSPTALAPHKAAAAG